MTLSLLCVIDCFSLGTSTSRNSVYHVPCVRADYQMNLSDNQWSENLWKSRDLRYLCRDEPGSVVKKKLCLFFRMVDKLRVIFDWKWLIGKPITSPAAAQICCFQRLRSSTSACRSYRSVRPPAPRFYPEVSLESLQMSCFSG